MYIYIVCVWFDGGLVVMSTSIMMSRFSLSSLIMQQRYSVPLLMFVCLRVSVCVTWSGLVLPLFCGKKIQIKIFQSDNSRLKAISVFSFM